MADDVDIKVSRSLTLGINLVALSLQRFPDLCFRVLDSSSEFLGNGPVALEIVPINQPHFFPPMSGKIQIDTHEQSLRETTLLVNNNKATPLSFDSAFYAERELNCVTNYIRIVISMTSWTARFQVLWKILEEVEFAFLDANQVWKVNEPFVCMLAKLNDHKKYKMCAGYSEIEVEDCTAEGCQTKLERRHYPAGSVRFESPSCLSIFVVNSNQDLPNQPFLRCQPCQKWLGIQKSIAKKAKSKANQSPTSVDRRRRRNISIKNCTPSTTKKRFQTLRKKNYELQQKINRMQQKLTKFELKLNHKQSNEMLGIVSTHNKNFRNEVHQVIEECNSTSTAQVMKAAWGNDRRKQHFNDTVTFFKDQEKNGTWHVTVDSTTLKEKEMM